MVFSTAGVINSVSISSTGEVLVCGEVHALNNKINNSQKVLVIILAPWERRCLFILPSCGQVPVGGSLFIG
jgi:hypothetical protein